MNLTPLQLTPPSSSVSGGGSPSPGHGFADLMAALLATMEEPAAEVQRTVGEAPDEPTRDTDVEMEGKRAAPELVPTSVHRTVGEAPDEPTRDADVEMEGKRAAPELVLTAEGEHAALLAGVPSRHPAAEGPTDPGAFASKPRQAAFAADDAAQGELAQPDDADSPPVPSPMAGIPPGGQAATREEETPEAKSPSSATSPPSPPPAVRVHDKEQLETAMPAAPVAQAPGVTGGTKVSDASPVEAPPPVPAVGDAPSVREARGAVGAEGSSHRPEADGSRAAPVPGVGSIPEKAARASRQIQEPTPGPQPGTAEPDPVGRPAVNGASGETMVRPAESPPGVERPAVAEAVDRIREWVERVDQTRRPESISIELPDPDGDYLIRLAMRDGRVELNVTRGGGETPSWLLDQLDEALTERGFDLAEGRQQRHRENAREDAPRPGGRPSRSVSNRSDEELWM